MLEVLINTFADGNKTQFARMLGVPAQNVSAWIARDTMNQQIVYKALPQISAHWLLTDGEGEMIARGEKTDRPELLEELRNLRATVSELTNERKRDSANTSVFHETIKANIATIADLRATITDLRATVSELRERLAIAEGKNTATTALIS